MAKETFEEQVQRLEMMAEDDGETWDLSDKDQAAIKAVLAAFNELRTKQSPVPPPEPELDRLEAAIDLLNSFVGRGDYLGITRVNEAREVIARLRSLPDVVSQPKESQ